MQCSLLAVFVFVFVFIFVFSVLFISHMNYCCSVQGPHSRQLGGYPTPTVGRGRVSTDPPYEGGLLPYQQAFTNHTSGRGRPTTIPTNRLLPTICTRPPLDSLSYNITSTPERTTSDIQFKAHLSPPVTVLSIKL